jgi:predicted nuclease with TOPRIM domain
MFHRFVCSSLEEMRAALKALEGNPDPQIKVAHRHLASLIEEVQTGANRMENALEKNSEVEHLERRYYELKDEIKQLKKEKTALRKELDKEECLEDKFNRYDDFELGI